MSNKEAATDAQLKCRVCGSARYQSLVASERMFGTGDEFTYRECDDCKSLSIAQVPADLAKHYPTRYYAHQPARPPFYAPPRSGMRKWASDLRATGYIWGRPALGRWLSDRFPGQAFAHVKRYLECIPNLRADSRVLDIGCGTGQFLFDMLGVGFTSLRGVDPYLESEIAVDTRLRIHASDAAELPSGRFDLVMMHHSLEHTSDPLAAMKDARRQLVDGGQCLIRVPVTNSDPWNAYREKWVELDAPRHLSIPSVAGMEALASAARFKMWRVTFDSDSFAYWGSELYLKSIPLIDPETRAFRNPSDHFSESELAEFERRASAANDGGQGGRAAFYMTAVS